MPAGSSSTQMKRVDMLDSLIIYRPVNVLTGDMVFASAKTSFPLGYAGNVRMGSK
jgi:hypothetical protein